MNKTEIFIKKAKKIHKDKYDYNLVNYKNANTKVSIFCPEHGIFFQTPNNHLNYHGCPKCGNKKTIESHKLTFEKFKKKAEKIHKKLYAYPKQELCGNNKKIKIICLKHGEFQQIVSDHLRGCGCPKCGKEKSTEISKSNTEEFISKAKIIHANKYDYSKTIYIKALEKLLIICPAHGEFYQKANSHLSGKGCPICQDSKGEKIIKEFLIKNNIKFIPQKKFKECKNIKVLPFDFYLTNLNACIEFDGMQHFKPIKGWKGALGLKQIQNRDKIKTKFCKQNSIPLLRIKYNENIEKKLENFLEKLF